MERVRLRQRARLTPGQRSPFPPSRMKTKWKQSWQRGDLQARLSTLLSLEIAMGPVCAQAKVNYTGTLFKTLFYIKPWNQGFREQMAGVFTLNMKLIIRSCVCEALGPFIPSFTGVLSSVISYYHVIRLFLNPYLCPPPSSFQTFSTSLYHWVRHLCSRC